MNLARRVLKQIDDRRVFIAEIDSAMNGICEVYEHLPPDAKGSALNLAVSLARIRRAFIEPTGNYLKVTVKPKFNGVHHANSRSEGRV